MSAADDVMEMQDLCGFIADQLTSSKKDKDRVKAVHDALDSRVSWNRAFEFLKGKARLVNSWEKDLARAKQAEIRATDRQRRTAEHVAWLRSTLDYATENGADMGRSDLAVVQRVLSRVGALDSALGNSFSAEDEDQSQGRGL